MIFMTINKVNTTGRTGLAWQQGEPPGMQAVPSLQGADRRRRLFKVGGSGRRGSTRGAR